MKICAVFCVFVALALGSPVPLNTQQCECSAAARSLLSSLSHIMQKEGKMEHRALFAGFNCTDLEAEMIPHTLTASVCQPSGSAHNASCSSHRRSSFSETECLRNIRADLSYYDVMLSSYRPSETDLSPVKTATKGLMNHYSAHSQSSTDNTRPTVQRFIRCLTSQPDTTY
uniref:Interleukin 12a n=1 Tax=Sinocyclocheilus grahami TaxID=75366 RepID=A0A672NUW0_SINGR